MLKYSENKIGSILSIYITFYNFSNLLDSKQSKILALGMIFFQQTRILRRNNLFTDLLLNTHST